MSSRKTVCLRRLGGDRKGELQAGRFFASPKVTAAKLVAGWSDLTGAACAGRHVLAIQDRSEVKFPPQHSAAAASARSERAMPSACWCTR
jgi:hypothetical protein